MSLCYDIVNFLRKMIFWTKFLGAAHGLAERWCAYHTAASSEKKPGGKQVFVRVWERNGWAASLRK